MLTSWFIQRIFWGLYTTVTITIVTYRLLQTVRNQVRMMENLNRSSFRLAANSAITGSKPDFQSQDQLRLEGEEQVKGEPGRTSKVKKRSSRTFLTNGVTDAMNTEHYATVAIGTTFIGPRKLANEALPPPMTEVKSAEKRVRSLKIVLLTFTLGFCSIAVGAAIFTTIPIVAAARLYVAYEESRGSRVIQDMLTMASEFGLLIQCSLRNAHLGLSPTASLRHHRLRILGSLCECTHRPSSLI